MTGRAVPARWRHWVAMVRVAGAVLALPALSRALEAQSIRVVASQSLNFGTMAPRLVRTVAPAATGAAVFTVQGPANASLLVTLTLPAVLSNGGQSVPLTAWRATTATGASGSPVNATPISGGDVALVLGSDGIGVLRLGATASPSFAVGNAAFTAAITFVAREPSSSRLSLTAQSVASAVVVQPISITALPMHFPSVYVGAPSVIAPEHPRAMRLLFDGALLSSIEVTFDALPSVLTRDGGSETLPITSWLQRTGANCLGSSSVALQGGVGALALTEATAAGGRSALCLGATVTPSPLQSPGTYRGNVTVSVRYTGA